MRREGKKLKKTNKEGFRRNHFMDEKMDTTEPDKT